MSLLDDVSIVVTPNAYTAGRLYGVLPTATEGSELITCGDFACADPNAAWSRGTGWAISGGTANSDGSQTSNSNLLQDTGASTVGKTFKISYKVSNYSAGAAFIGMGGYNYAAKDIEQNGEFTQYLLVANSSSNTNFYITANSDFVGSIDNISVKEFTGSDMDVTRATAATRVDENGLVNYAEILGSERVTNGDFATTSNWSENGGANAWSISGGKANCVAFASLRYFEQTNALETSGAGKTYKVVFTVSNYIQGVLRINVGGYQVGAAVTSNGTHTQYIAVTNASSNKSVYLQSNANTILSVDNISVKEEARNNVPRIDYTGGGCPHILAEPQRTNLVTYSEDFSNSSWTKDASTITPNAVTSPDGTLNADIIIATATNSSHSAFISLSSSTSSGTSYCYSFFAKAKEYTKAAIRIGGSGYSTQPMAVINLSNGSIVSQQGFTSISVTNFDNQWYKISAVFTATSSVAPNIQPIADGFTTTSDNYTYTGDGTSGIYIYGAQVEAGSYPTSYIPTSGSTVTRNQDVFSRDGISSLINSAEGVLFVEMAALADDLTNRAISLSDGTLNNGIQIEYFNVSNRIRFRVYAGGVLRATNQVIGITITNTNKLAFKWESGFMTVYINGSILNTAQAIAATPTGLDRLNFDLGQGSSRLFGKVKQLQVYKTALTNAQLTSLTS